PAVRPLAVAPPPPVFAARLLRPVVAAVRLPPPVAAVPRPLPAARPLRLVAAQPRRHSAAAGALAPPGLSAPFAPSRTALRPRSVAVAPPGVVGPAPETPDFSGPLAPLLTAPRLARPPPPGPPALGRSWTQGERRCRSSKRRWASAR